MPITPRLTSNRVEENLKAVLAERRSPALRSARNYKRATSAQSITRALASAPRFTCRVCRTMNGWTRQPQAELMARPHESPNAIRLHGVPASRGSCAAPAAANSLGLPRNGAFREVVDKSAPHNAAERVRAVVTAPNSMRFESRLGLQPSPGDSLMDARIEGALEHCVASTTTRRLALVHASSAWWSPLPQEEAGYRLAATSNGLRDPWRLECPGQNRE